MGEYSGQYMNAEEVLIKLKKLWKEHRAAKKITGELSKTIQNVIISKLAVNRKVTPEVMQNMMLREGGVEVETIEREKQ